MSLTTQRKRTNLSSISFNEDLASATSAKIKTPFPPAKPSAFKT